MTESWSIPNSLRFFEDLTTFDSQPLTVNKTSPIGDDEAFAPPQGLESRAGRGRPTDQSLSIFGTALISGVSIDDPFLEFDVSSKPEQELSVFALEILFYSDGYRSGRHYHCRDQGPWAVFGSKRVCGRVVVRYEAGSDIR